MIIFDASISKLPFDLKNNESLLKNLISRYSNAFRRIASHYESGKTMDYIVQTPDKRGKIKFFLSGENIGLSYYRQPLPETNRFAATFHQHMMDTEPHQSPPGLMQRGLPSQLASSLSYLSIDSPIGRD